MNVSPVEKKTSTFHDWPYSGPGRKCFHAWIVNLTPPGPDHCIHDCVYCYARHAVYTRQAKGELQVYSNLPELIGKDLDRIRLCPPFSISNTTDPCQPVSAVREQTARIVRLLLRRGPSFSITTKGDASFLLDIEGFSGFLRNFVAVSIEGPAQVLRLLSPGAPDYDRRLEAVSRLSKAGVKCIVRLDPVILHLWRAVYGEEGWKDQLRSLMRDFKNAGTLHVVSSTGRLSGAGPAPTMARRLREIVKEHSPAIASEMDGDYIYSREYTSVGYLLRKDKRMAFHRLARSIAEGLGMTYATCQETAARETDSPGIPHCEGVGLPFTQKGADGKFRPVKQCGANCHVECAGRAPPCGRRALVTTEPLKISKLR